MTRFSAPLKVKREFEDTTVARVDSSGSAVFAGGMRIQGPVDVSGAMNVSASARFIGPIIAGDGGAIGGVTMVQSTTVLSSASGPSGFGSTTVMRLPALAQIVDMAVHVRTSASGNAGGMLVRVGTSADEDQFGNILTSAIGTYRVGNAGNVLGAAASGAAWQSVGAAATQIHVDVTAQTSTTQTDLYNAILSVFYRMRSS